MSQKTTTPELKLSGQESDTLNLASPSEVLKVATLGPGTGASNIKQLLNEFKGLYEQRLRCLELDTTVTREQELQVSRSSSKCWYMSQTCQR